MNILKLNEKWERNKDVYAEKEIGNGVQEFVSDIFESQAIFGLNPGEPSTPDSLRRNEFTKEESKKKRRADMVIFINTEIIIPVEVEKYGSIASGEGQIMQYKADWEKKLGILTDGYIWRFFNNNQYRTFTLDYFFRKTDEFLAFWYEYIKPENYYISFFDVTGETNLFDKSRELHADSYRELFFEDITSLIRNFKKKLNIEGYFKGSEESDKERKATEITYAYIIQFILYKTLVGNDFAKFGKEFAERVETIRNGVQHNSFKEALGAIQGISKLISENVYRPFIQEQQQIDRTLQNLLCQAKNTLSDVSPWLDIFIFIKKYNFGNIRNEIFGYIYENYLKELYSEENKGQYFTDPAVVKFMLEQIGYTPENIKQRYYSSNPDEDISIIDPSCGSGTFLYSAADMIIDTFYDGVEGKSQIIENLINENIFGLDVSEFPLYLAEMNLLMRMLPLIITEKYNNVVEKKIKVFKTKDSIAEFIDTALFNTQSDEDIDTEKNKGQVSLFKEKLNLGYVSFVRDEDDLKKMKKSLEFQEKIPRRRFDFVIGNPPYVGYNECIRQNVLIFELMKSKVVKLNNIYGVNLHSIPGNPKKYRPNPNLYAFFIAIGIALLKDQGKLCFIIPQTFLINPDYDVLRYHLSKFVSIEKMIIFRSKMFVGRGLKGNKPIITSSLILVIKRKLPAPENQVDIIYYKEPDDDIEICLNNISNNKNISRKKISQRLLSENIGNWNFIKQDEEVINFYRRYGENENISIYYDHHLAEEKFGSRFYFDGGYDIDERTALIEKADKTDYEVLRFPDKGLLIKGNKGYWPDCRNPKEKYFIRLRQANQGYHLLDSKYKVIWPYLRDIRFVFTDKSVIWSRRTTSTYYGIGSENKQELFYLLSLLNSCVTKKIVEMFKLDNESKREIMVSSSLIKKEIRVPKITKKNQHIKDEIIRQTEELLRLEEITLSDLVSFSGVMMQKFDAVKVEKDNLVLLKDGIRTDCKIRQNTDIIYKKINERYSGGETINLSELKSLPIIDNEIQKKIQDYIDDLVFALYFDAEISNIGIGHAEAIKDQCRTSRFYEIVHS